jgi:hypothetical protein
MATREQPLAWNFAYLRQCWPIPHKRSLANVGATPYILSEPLLTGRDHALYVVV